MKCHPPGADNMWLPFNCPLDHVLDLEALDDAANEHGWPLLIREGGFTANPRVPAAVKVQPGLCSVTCAG